jgi:hypothetical protein
MTVKKVAVNAMLKTLLLYTYTSKCVSINGQSILRD